MVFARRRLMLWLLKAYIKKWGRSIVVFFLIGLLVFFTLRVVFLYFLPKIPFGGKEVIGVAGDYSFDLLPPLITSQVSLGLTQVTENGEVQAGIAKSWLVENDGKKYVFFLDPRVVFSDGTKIDSGKIQYPFKDVVIKRPDTLRIEFNLKDSYSPFLVTVSKPVFKDDVIGVGEYIVKDIKLNGTFIKSLLVSSKSNRYRIKMYNFYPSQDALKLAFILGEVKVATGLTDLSFEKKKLSDFPNTISERTVNYRQLVTLFYNTKDPALSDPKLRGALSYAVPDEFSYGERSYGPYPMFSWAYSTVVQDHKQDIAHARLLLKAALGEDQKTTTIVIKVLQKYKGTANEIAKSWESLGVTTKIEEVDARPSSFQVFLGDYSVSRDPDQYALWHSDQEKNITKYDNKRIDKLLEDGRKITDREGRKKIYDDFQKYLLADSPAVFLYFPYEYLIKRK